jgi:hypothetical protein
LAAVTPSAATDVAGLPALQQRLALLNAANLLLLMSVVWAMVFKPVL